MTHTHISNETHANIKWHTRTCQMTHTHISNDTHAHMEWRMREGADSSPLTRVETFYSLVCQLILSIPVSVNRERSNSEEADHHRIFKSTTYTVFFWIPESIARYSQIKHKNRARPYICARIFVWFAPDYFENSGHRPVFFVCSFFCVSVSDWLYTLKFALNPYRLSTLRFDWQRLSVPHGGRY